jgi:hypothetical protein
VNYGELVTLKRSSVGRAKNEQIKHDRAARAFKKKSPEGEPTGLCVWELISFKGNTYKYQIDDQMQQM